MKCLKYLKYEIIKIFLSSAYYKINNFRSIPLLKISGLHSRIFIRFHLFRIFVHILVIV